MFRILQCYLWGKSLPNEFDRLGIQNVALINSFFIGTASGESFGRTRGMEYGYESESEG